MVPRNIIGCQWRGAPAATESFVVTLFDRDEHSTPSGWWHWVMYDLPKATSKLEAVVQCTLCAAYRVSEFDLSFVVGIDLLGGSPGVAAAVYTKTIQIEVPL